MKKDQTIIEINYDKMTDDELLKIINDNDKIRKENYKKEDKIGAGIVVGTGGCLIAQITCMLKSHAKLSFGFFGGILVGLILRFVVQKIFKNVDNRITAQKAKINQMLLDRAVEELKQKQENDDVIIDEEVEKIEEEICMS